LGRVASADLTTSPSATASAHTGTGGDTGGIGTTSGGTNVVVAGDISFDLPDGYEIEQQDDGFVQVFGDGGYFFAIVSPPPADANTMITDTLDGLQSLGVQDLAVSDPQDMQIPTSSVVQCVLLGFQGTLASQQGGTIPLEGFAYYFVLQDGTGVTAFTLYQQGALDDDGSPLIAGYNQIYNSLISSF
jgi:hypothetical protein